MELDSDSLTLLFRESAALSLASIREGQEFFVGAKAAWVRKKASRRFGGLVGTYFLYSKSKRWRDFDRFLFEI